MVFLFEREELTKDTGGATKASAEYHLPDYTEPEPGQRPPKGARLRRKVKLPETM